MSGVDSSAFGLAALLNPVSISDFFQDYWEKQPLLISRDDRDNYARLLSLGQIESIINETELPDSALDVVNANSPIGRGDFMTNGLIDVLKVWRLFSEGASILLPELQKRVSSLAFLCRMLEAEFSAPFQTNIYLTPPGAQGFKPHYDTHDVFLLQVAGSKAWTIAGCPVQLPLRVQPFDSGMHAIGETTLLANLHAGDLLYIPRGWIHYAKSHDEISLHITLGALSYTWSDIVVEAISNLCLTDAEFRRAIPVGFANSVSDKTARRATFAKLLSRMVQVDLDAVFDRFADDFVTTRRPLMQDQLAQLTHTQVVSVSDVFAPRPGVIYRLSESPTGLLIRCHGREISLPRSAGAASRFALATPRYSIHDLPGGLDEPGKIALIQRLIVEGLLVRVMQP